ncbi:pathway-specific nitrogen regulator [Metarhizium album ARSEF 1941]|uniref:Pathway-specific nitrogen regulator n=1 Tax=Metarhizium album (strain ARSEF 1941) TaxID=1081103 RepID=A0A0B2WWC5_METAS|nr:pathway-specific nitrogen regulator [Metarhizium album ARSEF 1941]KHN97909.1 pathway-specific nitrogen regulator [Metarhizium album ARSEF 1941]
MEVNGSTNATSAAAAKTRSRRRAASSSQKRRCISTACVACRKRKSKCDGASPSCAACASVYGTECIYDPNSDHRRKGVYREKVDTMKARSATLQILVEAILNASEDNVASVVDRIRSCDDLEALAQSIVNQDSDSGVTASNEINDDDVDPSALKGEEELARKMGELRFENGSVRFIGGTSHLLHLGDAQNDAVESAHETGEQSSGDDPIASWTRVTSDANLITHLMGMYFNYHYSYFTTLSKKLFIRDFTAGLANVASRNGTAYCSPLLVNAMLALGCHFTDVAGAFLTPGDARTKGDHFFAEAKRLILQSDEFARPRLVTVQALALMSVREAGCGREAKGWVYSGMSFRMAQDIGLNLEVMSSDREHMSNEEIDARKITYWGCFVFDKCWSNYMGRLPQLVKTACNVTKFNIDNEEDSSTWSPLSDKGLDKSFELPSRTRSAALQLISICEISSDLMVFFYHPSHIGRSRGKSTELKKLSEIHQRLEHWHKTLPKEFEPAEGQLPNVILMHMFYHLQYIHLFRPFLRYTPSASPLPAHVSPRRICTANAGAISKLMRLYKRMYGLRQVCNIAVYMIHSACIIHLLNLPEKSARRDIIHGVKHLEEIADDWLCACRTLRILSVLARKWGCELPEDAAFVLRRADEKYGYYSTSDVPSPASSHATSGVVSDDATSRAPGEHSPLEQFAQAAQAAQAAGGVRPGCIDERMSLLQPSQMTEGVADQLSHQERAARSEVVSLGVGGNTMEPWLGNGNPASASPSGFGSPFCPVDQQVSKPQNIHHVVPPHVAGSAGNEPPNGQDWMLNDGARWQQSFESWGMDGGVPPNGIFIFNQHQTNNFNQPTGGYRNDQGQVILENPNASVSQSGWLPGLD